MLKGVKNSQYYILCGREKKRKGEKEEGKDAKNFVFKKKYKIQKATS